MDIEKYKDKILGWFKQWFDQNYRSGVPRIPPHKHNGIDNLPINYKDIIGTIPSSSSGGGNGGTPADPVNSIQFNNGGVFGGDSKLLYDATSAVITFDKGTGNGDGGIITGGTSDISLETKGQSVPGNINILGGYVIDNTVTATQGSNITVKGGDLSEVDFGLSRSGDVIIEGGDDINVIGYQRGVDGVVAIKRKAILYATNYTSFYPDGRTKPIPIFIIEENVTVSPITSAITAAGYLYVSSGALHYVGSSGTDTVIAPA